MDSAGAIDIDSEDSIQQFLSGKKRRQNLTTALQPKADVTKTEIIPPEPDLNQIELGPVGKRGAAAALQRLEEIEERAHARLMRAIEIGNPFQVKAAQEFYLRSSETLRRLDLAVETERRKADEQVPKMLVENVAWQISDWWRLGFAQFLSSESERLMEINDLGEFKAHAINRFKGVLHTTVKTSLKTDSPIPEWAAAKVIEAWNIPAF